jgi:anaerobic selenocysteine-containing dehydrogenase
MPKKGSLAGNKTSDKKVHKEKTFLKTLGFGPNSNSVAVDVHDGKLTRLRPLHFDSQYDSAAFNPWEMKVRGKPFGPGLKSLPAHFALAYKKRVYSPNRILYPLKRVDWNPDGDRNTENRGKSKYVKISWDEALDIVVKEIKRIKEKYTTYAILCQQDGHAEQKIVHTAHGSSLRLLEMLGGYTLQTRNPDSWEGWYWGGKHAWGMEPVGQMEPVTNVMLDIAENSKQVLFWGCDPETTPQGLDGQMASRLCYWWTEVGVKSLYICPDLNYGAAVHADKWIPIMPNTDAALELAIAYTWIKENSYDKDYVGTHTFGYEKFEEYVLGKEDGIPKTPAWAAEKTGIPEWTIKALAREWASKRTSIAHGNGGPRIRGPYSTENARLEILLLAMQGLGKPGAHQVKMIEWGMQDRQPMPLSTVVPNLSAVSYGNVPWVWHTTTGIPHRAMGTGLAPGNIFPKQFIPKNLIHDAILHPPISWYGTTLLRASAEDQFTKYTYPAEGCPEVHMIWSDSPCWITCWNDTNTYIKALRSPKIEFIMTQHPWLENDCLFADVILPVNTKLEEQDINADFGNGQYRILLNEKQCIKPVGESKTDYEIVCAIAEKFGLLEEYTGGKSVDALIKKTFLTSGVQELTSWEQFDKKDYFVVPTDPDWKKYPAGMKKFYEAPENNRLKTPTGKIEFYSKNLARYFPDDNERPPVPHWIEKGEGHDESLSSARAGLYPLLMMSNHPRWRVHANHDDISWIREIQTCKVAGPDGYKYEPLWINPADAAKRGINQGDVVTVYNERGAVLGGAYVTERLMPGVVYMDHGARYDPIVPGEIDRGGAINTITPHNMTSKNATGMVVSGFLVEIQKADVGLLTNKYPEAFARKYDSGAGLRFDAWVEKS